MPSQKILGIVLITGSIIFLIAAFHPVSKIFGEPDSSKRLEIILNEQAGWNFSQLLFIIGSFIVAIAVGLISHHFRNIPGSTLAYLGSVMLLAGALLWSIHCYLRFQDPSAFVSGSLPGWHFLLYTFLTMAGLALLDICWQDQRFVVGWDGR